MIRNYCLKVTFLILGVCSNYALSTEAPPAASDTEIEGGAPPPLDGELLEFLADFSDTDEAQFELIMFHGVQDAEKNKRNNLNEKKDVSDEVTHD